MAATAGPGGGETAVASAADEGGGCGSGGDRGSPPGSDLRRLGPGGREEVEAPGQVGTGGPVSQSHPPSSPPPPREAEVTVEIGETYLCRRGDGTWRKCVSEATEHPSTPPPPTLRFEHHEHGWRLPSLPPPRPPCCETLPLCDSPFRVALLTSFIHFKHFSPFAFKGHLKAAHNL